MRNAGVMRRSIALLAALAASLLATGCSQGPRSCREVFNAVRCQTMTDFVAIELGTTRDQVTRLMVLPFNVAQFDPGATLGVKDIAVR